MAKGFARAALLGLIAGVLHAGALAHDAGSANGVFRSRDGGLTWLPLSPPSFAPGVLALAVHPNDPHQLLLATDSGLQRSRNGGRDWDTEAAHVLNGPAFAVAFDADGREALASGAQALYRTEGPHWREARTPTGSAPARALLSGGVAGRVYLAGWSGLYRSDNWGRSWSRVGSEIGSAPVSALVVTPTRIDTLHALADGRVWSSSDGARSWRIDAHAPSRADALAIDRGTPARLWVVAAGRVHRRDAGGAGWQPVGTPIPDAQAIARSIDVIDDALLVVTDRGVYRSPDRGATWALLGSDLPTHSEASLLLREASAPATLYAGFSRTGVAQLKPASSALRAPDAWRDIAPLAAVYAGLGLLLLAVGLVVRRVTRNGTPTVERTIPLHAESP